MALSSASAVAVKGGGASGGDKSEQAEQLRTLLLSTTSSSPQDIQTACTAVEAALLSQPLDSFYRLCFPVLLHKLFGFQNSSALSNGWLSQPSPASSSCLISLLSPSSALLSPSSPSLVFAFPSERLPDWTLRLLSLPHGPLLLSQSSALFHGRVLLFPPSDFQVQLDAFEYFFFWFAYYAVCKESTSRPRSNPPIWAAHKRSLPNWVPGFSHNSFSNHPLDPYLQLLHLYLAHFVPVSCPTTTTATTTASGISKTGSFRADFLVHTLVEFWLIDDDPLPLPRRLRQSLGLPILGGAVPTTYVLPASQLTDALRVFVHHMNTLWAASLLADGRPSASGGPTVPHNRYAQVLQRPFYRFFLRAFSFWTPGSPVKKAVCVVDVLLDYLQPWSSSPSGSVEHQGTETRSAKGAMQSAVTWGYSERWRSFVTANYLFYTILFVHFLEFALKFMHADPEAVLQMTSKILNVLAGSSDLLDSLRKVDAICNTTSGISQDSHNIVSAIREQLEDWEESLNVDCNRDCDGQLKTSHLRFFSPSEVGGQQILQMLILQAEGEIQTVSHATQVSCTKVLEAIKKAGQTIFKSGAILSPAVTHHTEVQPIAHPVVASRAFPQHTWSNVRYKGDWMRRPIESTEVAWLVRYLVWLSDNLNATLGLMPNSVVPEGMHQPLEMGRTTVMGQASTTFAEINSPQCLYSSRDSFLNFHWTKFLSIGFSFIRSCWLILHHHLQRRGWRVNLRFMAKKSIVVAALLFVTYVMRKLLIHVS